MSVFSFDPSSQLSIVALRVKNRDQMINFYCEMLGFKLKTEENELAILVAEDGSHERIWLEESPRATEHFGEVKRLNYYKVEVPTLSEFAAVYSRLVHAKYPVIQAEFTPDLCQFTIVDPEGNQLAIRTPETVSIDETSLLTSADPNKKLSSKARIAALGLHAQDVQEECQFLADLLGFEFDENNIAFQTLADGEFDISIIKHDTENVKIPSHQILGLDFLKFQLQDEQFEQLLKHVQESQMKHYLDSKQKILTVYDPVGVEWWFLR